MLLNHLSRALGGLALAGVLALSAPVHAQETGVGGQLEQSSSTTPKEKKDFSTAALAEMQAAAKSVSKLLEQAEKEKDIVKIQCLTKKKAGIQALVEVSESSALSMEQALAEGDSQRADHEFRKVAVALSKVRQFLAEADACVGDAGAAPGVTEVDVTAEGLTDSEDTEPIYDGVIDVDVDPPDTSPYF